MKKVINRKIYDSDKATHVGQWDNGYNRNDFQVCEEDLYITDKGNWFLHGIGGPMSKYTRHQGNMSIGGEDIIAMTPEEARRWLETHNFIGALESYFPDNIEDA